MGKERRGEIVVVTLQGEVRINPSEMYRVLV